MCHLSFCPIQKRVRSQLLWELSQTHRTGNLLLSCVCECVGECLSILVHFWPQGKKPIQKQDILISVLFSSVVTCTFWRKKFQRILPRNPAEFFRQFVIRFVSFCLSDWRDDVVKDKQLSTVLLGSHGTFSLNQNVKVFPSCFLRRFFLATVTSVWLFRGVNLHLDFCKAALWKCIL